MRIAHLFDGRDSSGEGWIDPNRPRIDDQEERKRIGRFLLGGVMILRVPGRDRDALEPSREFAVPLSTFTDGTWIWDAGVRYYLLEHGIAPEPEFVDHIRACGYVANEPDEPGWQEALRVLLDR